MKAEPFSPPLTSSTRGAMVVHSASPVSGSTLASRTPSIQPAIPAVVRVKSEAPDIKPVGHPNERDPPPMLSLVLPTSSRDRLTYTRSPTPTSKARSRQTSTPRRRVHTTPSRTLALGSTASTLARSGAVSAVRSIAVRSNSRVRNSTARSQSRSTTPGNIAHHPQARSTVNSRSVILAQHRRIASLTPEPHRSESEESGPSHLSLSMERSVTPIHRPPRRVMERPVREQAQVAPMGPPPDPLKPAMAQAVLEILDVIRQIKVLNPAVELEVVDMVSDLLRTSFGTEGGERGKLIEGLQLELDYDEFATGSHLSNLLSMLERGCSRVIQHRIKNPLPKGRTFNVKDQQFMNTLYILLDDTRDNALKDMTLHEANHVMFAWRTILVEKRDVHAAKLRRTYPNVNRFLIPWWIDCVVNLSKAVIAETWP